jgi:hypothetical protein
MTKDERITDERLAALIQYGAPGGLAPHDFARIVRELKERRAHVEELKRLLKFAAVYSSFAKHMSETFQKDAIEALTHD